MECPHCHTYNPAGAHFCGRCGKRMVAYLGDPFGNGPAPNTGMRLGAPAVLAAVAAAQPDTTPSSHVQPNSVPATTTSREGVGLGTTCVWVFGLLLAWGYLSWMPYATLAVGAAYVAYAMRNWRVGCGAQAVMLLVAALAVPLLHSIFTR
ncbi:MAG: zinc-ribbon domain-containing protein [Chloroflexota bacterium]